MHWPNRKLDRSVVRGLAIAIAICCLGGDCHAECGSPTASSPVTYTDESTVLFGARQLVNGTNTTVDSTTPGQIRIHASTGTSGGPATSVTAADETSSFTSSRQLSDGSGTTVNTGT